MRGWSPWHFVPRRSLFLEPASAFSLFSKNVQYTIKTEDLDLHPGESDYLQVVGTNTAGHPVTIVVRIDDRHKPSYHNRVNYEQQVLPGSFTFDLPIGGLRTVSGRKVRSNEILRVVVFVAGDDDPVEGPAAEIQTPSKLPGNTQGFDFGPEHAAIFPGFEKVGPDDPRLSGPKLTAKQRPSGDALVADGIRGINRFEVEFPNGLYRVTLWTEDYGEWQSLPYWTERRIMLNGQPVRDQEHTAEDWMRNSYGRWSA